MVVLSIFRQNVVGIFYGKRSPISKTIIIRQGMSRDTKTTTSECTIQDAENGSTFKSLLGVVQLLKFKPQNTWRIVK